MDPQPEDSAKSVTPILENQEPSDIKSEPAMQSLSRDSPVPQTSEPEWTNEAESEREFFDSISDGGQVSASCSNSSSRLRFHHPIYDLYEKLRTIISAVGMDSVEFRCNFCAEKQMNTIIKAKNSTTTNLIRHIQRAHKAKYVIFENTYKAYQNTKLRSSRNCKPKQKAVPGWNQPKQKPGPRAAQPRQKSVPPEPVKSGKMHPEEKNKLDFLVALMVAQDSQPVSVVENQGFQNLMNGMNPSYEIPSRKNLTYCILPRLEKEVRDKVSQELGKAKHLALTCDMRTLRAKDAYLTLTAHVLQPPLCVRKSFCLGVKSFREKHTAEHVAEQIRLILEEYNVDIDGISSVTTDNGCSIVNAVSFLGLSEKHVRCIGNCFHLIVTKAIKEVRSVDKIFEKCRAISKFFSNSPAATHLLLDMQAQSNLPETRMSMDVVPRWNSIYELGQRVLDQDIAINAALFAAAQTGKSRVRKIPEALTLDEAAILKDTLEILGPFVNAIEKISGHAYVTSSLVIPVIAELQDSLEALSEQYTAAEMRDSLEALSEQYRMAERSSISDENDDDVCQVIVCPPPERNSYDSTIPLLCRTVKALVSGRFDNIESHSVLGKSTILDPRFKSFGFRDRKAADCHAKELEVEIQQLMRKTSDAELSASAEPPSKKSKPGLNIWKSVSLRRAEYEKAQKTTISELDVYIAENIEDPLTDVFSWWGSNASKYPLLSQLAFKYMCGSATAIPTEQLFTKAGDVVCSRRRRSYLKPAHLEMLTLIKTNYSQCH